MQNGAVAMDGGSASESEERRVGMTPALGETAAASGGIPYRTESEPLEHRSGIIPTLQNVVATSGLGCRLDLKRIAQHARNAEYNPKRFAAVIMRIRDPKTTALIFSSGKMVCTGAKSEQDARLASRKYAKIVSKLGYTVTFQGFRIENIVGSCDVQFNIGLEGLNFKHRFFSRYEPELFPGLIYKMKIPKVVLLVFVSGKVVLTGARTRREIYQAFENIYPALQEFRKGRRATPTPTTSYPTHPSSEVKPREELGNGTQLPVPHCGPDVSRLERTSDIKAALTPYLSSVSLSQQSLPEDSKMPGVVYGEEPSVRESLYSPYGLQVAPSVEFTSALVYQAPPTPQVGGGNQTTPYAFFVPPPTPKN